MQGFGYTDEEWVEEPNSTSNRKTFMQELLSWRASAPLAPPSCPPCPPH